MILVTIIVFLLVLTVLVVAHEYGHYLFARRYGMEVEEFCALGLPFGKKIELGRNKDGMVFTMYPFVPLGGFVKIKGMIPQEDGGEVHIPGGFYSKPPWQRIVVLFAGPVFSLLAGVIALIPLYMAVGVQGFSSKPVIGYLSKEGVAAKVGMKPGDRILSVDGTQVSTFFDMASIVREKPNQTIEITFERKAEKKTVQVTPTPLVGPVLDRNFEPTAESRLQGKLGIKPMVVRTPLAFARATEEAVLTPWKMLSGLVKTKPAEFKDQVGGPIAIFQATGQMVEEGMADVIGFACMLSISLGILNLLPIPPFDGGQMLIAFVEMIGRRKRLSMRLQTWMFGVGYVLVVLLLLVTTANDIGRFFR